MKNIGIAFEMILALAMLRLLVRFPLDIDCRKKCEILDTEQFEIAKAKILLFIIGNTAFFHLRGLR